MGQKSAHEAKVYSKQRLVQKIKRPDTINSAQPRMEALAVLPMWKPSKASKLRILITPNTLKADIGQSLIVSISVTSCVSENLAMPD